MRRHPSLAAALALAVLAFTHQFPVRAQAPSTEARAARAYQAAVHDGPLALRAFLDQFPKGADLHIHLSGAIYAETFLRDAAEDKLCIDLANLKFARDDQGNPIKEPCAPPLTPASQVASNQGLYDRLVNAFSMRSFVPTSGYSGHDQFFATFSRYGGLDKKHIGEWVDEVASRAAAQNQQYVELMETPIFTHAAYIATQNPLKPDPTAQDFAAYRDTLFAVGLRDEIFVDREDVRAAEALRREIEHCDTSQPASACQVEVRYIYQILRGNSPEQVFAQTLLAFETISQTMAANEAGFVGLNFVMPEDGYLSMRDYTLQMKMLDYLHSVYPKVHISLHAGELAPGLVPPEGLRFHIRQAVELGHAERIGHGVDIAEEYDAPGLLKVMAARHVMVEINLSSNEGILGVKGAEHPFTLYRAAHVPVALSTDDEGVSRIEITGEYLRAALDYHLSYTDLKQLARTGLEHSFLPGESLWAAPDTFTTAAAACKDQPLGTDKPTVGCKAFLDSSQKAAAQWELEQRFRAFEAKFQ
jgi:adenosine deaminase